MYLLLLTTNFLYYKRLDGFIKSSNLLFFKDGEFMAIKPVFLEKFLNDPSYVDGSKLGTAMLKKWNYEKRYDYITRAYNKFEVLYFKENELSYYVMVVVPSELRGCSYDVVFHFYTENSSYASRSSIKDYNIQIFSNNPVMGFYYAYANFNKGLIIPFLAEKYSKEMLTTPANKNNPKSEIGIDHSLYHAGKYLLSQARYLNKTWIESKTLAFKEDTLLKLVRHIDVVMAEYRKLKNKEGNKERFNKNEDFVETAKDTVGNIVAHLGTGKDKIKDIFSGDEKKKVAKSKSAIRKITAKKSNSSQSAVRTIKPRKRSPK